MGGSFPGTSGLFQEWCWEAQTRAAAGGTESSSLQLISAPGHGDLPFASQLPRAEDKAPEEFA